MLGRPIALALAGMLAQAPAALAVDGLTLAAEAGLHGLCKPGRWTPVRIVVVNGTEDIDGDLIVEWGHARVTRAVELPAPSQRHFEMYVRSGEVRDVVVVRLRSNGREMRKIEVPVQVVGIDEAVTLCLGAPGELSTSVADCSVTIAGDALPRSWRGYDAASQVLPASGTILTPERRSALELSRAIKRVDAAGGLAPATGLVPAAAGPASRVRGVLATYVFMIGLVGFVWRRERSRAGAVYPALVVIALAGSIVAAMVGRSSAVVVHHASVAQQFAGAAGALISMRALAEYPTNGRFALTASIGDGSIDIHPAREELTEERFEAAGRPLLDDASGMGATRAFTLEGSSDFRALDVSRNSGATRVTNVSTLDLTDCELPPAFPAPPRRMLKPGEYFETTQVVTGVDPVITCRFPGSPIEFTDPRHGVTTDGSTIVLYHLSTAPTSDDSH